MGVDKGGHVFTEPLKRLKRTDKKPNIIGWDFIELQTPAYCVLLNFIEILWIHDIKNMPGPKLTSSLAICIIQKNIYILIN